MWKFLDVRDPAVRSRLREVSWGQPQVTDASHLVVFCARRDFKPEDVQRYLERIVEVRGVAMDSLDQYRARIFELVDSKSPEVLKAWAGTAGVHRPRVHDELRRGSPRGHLRAGRDGSGPPMTAFFIWKIPLITRFAPWLWVTGMKRRISTPVWRKYVLTGMRSFRSSDGVFY